MVWSLVPISFCSESTQYLWLTGSLLVPGRIQAPGEGSSAQVLCHWHFWWFHFTSYQSWGYTKFNKPKLECFITGHKPIFVYVMINQINQFHKAINWFTLLLMCFKSCTWCLSSPGWWSFHDNLYSEAGVVHRDCHTMFWSRSSFQTHSWQVWHPCIPFTCEHWCSDFVCSKSCRRLLNVSDNGSTPKSSKSWMSDVHFSFETTMVTLGSPFSDIPMIESHFQTLHSQVLV